MNNETLQRKRANHRLATYFLHNVFKAFENGERKPEIYREILLKNLLVGRPTNRYRLKVRTNKLKNQNKQNKLNKLNEQNNCIFGNIQLF